MKHEFDNMHAGFDLVLHGLCNIDFSQQSLSLHGSGLIRGLYMNPGSGKCSVCTIPVPGTLAQDNKQRCICCTLYKLCFRLPILWHCLVALIDEVSLLRKWLSLRVVFYLSPKHIADVTTDPLIHFTATTDSPFSTEKSYARANLSINPDCPQDGCRGARKD